MAQQQVFISYAWGGESEIVANEIEAELTDKGIRLVRDKTDLGFKGLIREFMEEIGQGNLVVLVISDKYLKSKNCMFELLEVEKKGEFHSRIFPVVLPDADIYDSLGIINYLKYWDQKIKELNASVKELDNLADTRKVQEDINLYTDIRGTIDDLAGKLSNMNTLTLEIMRAKKYQPLLDALLKQSGENPIPSPIPTPPSKKLGKVLYHIPGMMQVEKWTRCTVRLAWEELLLTAGLDIPEEERIIEPIRMGNVMQVSLSEGRDGGNFEIRELNNEEQVIFDDDFTEWLFDVKPHTIGQFTLVLRVTLIQMMDGKERKKDLVLERNVITEAIVPDALARFEIAENGLIPPLFDNEDSKPKSLDTFSKPKQKEKFPETFEDYEQPPTQQKSGTRAPQSPPPLATIPDRPSPKAQHAPRSKSTSFRKILPYAASLAVLIVVGALFFPRFGTQYSPDYKASSPNEEGVGSPMPGNASNQGKMLVALSLESTTPSGEAINEVLLFTVGPLKLDSLAFLNPGNFSLEVFPASDTADLNFGNIPELTVLEIQDSVQKVLARPAVVGNQLIERNQLKTDPESRIIKTRPQRLDSVSKKKLQIHPRNLHEY